LLGSLTFSKIALVPLEDTRLQVDARAEEGEIALFERAGHVVKSH
jgi:hypothetical protein